MVRRDSLVSTNRPSITMPWGVKLKFGTSPEHFSFTDEFAGVSAEIVVRGKQLNSLAIHQILASVEESMSKLKVNLTEQLERSMKTLSLHDQTSTSDSSLQPTIGSLKSMPVDIRTGVMSEE